MPRHPDVAVPTCRLPSCVPTVWAVHAPQVSSWVGTSESPAGQAQSICSLAFYRKSPPRVTEIWRHQLPVFYPVVSSLLLKHLVSRLSPKRCGVGLRGVSSHYTGLGSRTEPHKRSNKNWRFPEPAAGAPTSSILTVAPRRAPTPTGRPSAGLPARGAAESSGTPHFFHSLWLG